MPNWVNNSRAVMHDLINLNRRVMVTMVMQQDLPPARWRISGSGTGCFTCYTSSELNGPPLCMVNAAIGKEREFEIRPANKKEKGVDCGGRTRPEWKPPESPASRGHKVILYEKQNKLGGSLPLAAMVKGFEREDFLGFVHYLSNQMTELGVDVRLGKEINRESLKRLNRKS